MSLILPRRDLVLRVVEASISGSQGHKSAKFKASGNSMTLGVSDIHASQRAMDNPAPGHSLSTQMQHVDLKKKYDMQAFKDPCVVFKRWRAMTLIHCELREQRFDEIFLLLGTSAFVTPIFKGQHTSSDTAQSTLKTLAAVAEVSYEFLVEQNRDYEFTHDQIAALKANIHVVPLQITALTTSLTGSFTSAGCSSSSSSTRHARQEKVKKRKLSTP